LEGFNFGNHLALNFGGKIHNVRQLVVIDVVGQLDFIDVNKQWLPLMSIDVMGVFG
jgi:hypothetical protein